MILIVSPSKKKAQSASEIFHYMGVVSYAASPSEALSEMSALYRATLIIDPQKLPDAESFIRKLRSYHSSAPVFAISDGEITSSHLYDACFSDSIYSSTLIEEIVKHQHSHRLPLSAHYRLAGIDASCYTAQVTYFDKRIPLTKTETMIIRYLTASYPALQSAKNLVKYAFKPSKKPEISSIRTHISVINKKFKEITGRNLIMSIPKSGYTIATPQMIQSLKADCGAQI